MIAEVIVDILNSNVDKIFDYKMQPDANYTVGSRVLVPFAGRKIEGYIINTKDASTLDDAKLKTIIQPLDTQPVLSQKMVQLCFFMKEKFYLRLADTIRLFLPPEIRGGQKPKIVQIASITPNCDISQISKRATSQLALVLYLQQNAQEQVSVLNNKFGSSALKKLVELGFVKIDTQTIGRKPVNAFTVKKKNITLTDQQNKAIEFISNSHYNTFLLHGVTGSGKTEVYIECMKKVIEQGKSAILLVPEISLTPQMLSRFRNAFGDTVAILHSMLSSGERYDEWYRLKNGQAKIAIGARSCIFAPLDNVGLIVIDEEHDQSYFSESNPRYYTHDVARYLGYLNDCPVILGSATPSINSYYHAQIGTYKLINLPNRANNQQLPSMQIVDMLSEIRNGNTGIFSTALVDALKDCISNNKQAMLFINRRGYASFMMCKECGYVAKCTDCDVSLVYHKEDNMLKCHYCNKRYRALTTCPECHSKYIKYGAVGTQQIAEALQKAFPDVTILRLDNDTTQNKNSYVQILEQFNNTTPAILVGTQMIAKGHDFNNVTLVGIIDADLSLHFSDFRATERTFQLITQVAGRAGRSEFEGRVVLQTYFPKHYVYRCATNYDYPAFYRKEINLRQIAHFPPFTKILRVLITGENEEKVIETSRNISNAMQQLKQKYSSDFVYLQAMKCPKKRIQNKFRYQILARYYTKNDKDITTVIYDICSLNTQQKISIFVENNPQNLS